jgi:hypothetical protein
MAKKCREYAQLRAQFLEDHPVCQVWLKLSGLASMPPEAASIASILGIAIGPASTEIHHMRGRGKYFLDVTTWLAVCAENHRKIEDNKQWAIEHGFLSPDKNRRPLQLPAPASHRIK